MKMETITLPNADWKMTTGTKKSHKLCTSQKLILKWMDDYTQTTAKAKRSFKKLEMIL